MRTFIATGIFIIILLIPYNVYKNLCDTKFLNSKIIAINFILNNLSYYSKIKHNFDGNPLETLKETYFNNCNILLDYIEVKI